jgi:hypothetical protein
VVRHGLSRREPTFERSRSLLDPGSECLNVGFFGRAIRAFEEPAL